VTSAAQPRDAATVLLLRPRSGSPDAAVAGIEVWMMKRRPTMAFAPNAWVFPGGSVLRDDVDPIRFAMAPAFVRAVGVDAARCSTLVEAAVRETFEESGVALARAADGSVVPWSLADATALEQRTTSLTHLLAASGATAAVDALHPWARWLTPASSPIRFDTWFFAVDARPWPEPMHVDDGEASQSRWWTPAELLVHASDTLLPPTLDALQRLAATSTVEDALAAAPAVLEQRAG
jgi:8-oxo-dGTP pyrophosphatase MutT (NUDIX family)